MRWLAPVLVAVALAAAPPAAAQQPDVVAPSAIVVEASTGAVAFEKASGDERAIASTTKLMTALLTLESAALDDVLTAVPYAPLPAESIVGLQAGERMTVRDLLVALLLPSANDAAVTLATGISGSVDAFVDEMNARARELGLRDTRFANPVGLDEEGNRSSARDLVKLTAVLRENDFFRETTDRPRATLRSGAVDRVVLNRNRLVREVPRVDGVKTGRTLEAGYVLVGSATRDGVTVLSAVLGEPTEAARDEDTLELLDFGLGRFERVTPVREGATLRRAGLEYRDEQVALVAASPVRHVVRRGERPRVRVVGAPDELSGPLTAGSRVGTVEVRVGDEVVARTPLVTATAVAEASIGERLESVLVSPSAALLLAGLVACTVLLVLLRRRVLRRVGGPA